MKINLTLILLVMSLTLAYTQKLPFIFLGVKTDFQPDFSVKLEAMVYEKLENLQKIDQLSSFELKGLLVKGIISNEIPTEVQSKAITDILGPVLISSVYLTKIKSKAKNNFWPPFSRDIQLFGKIELVVLNTQSGELLFSGDLPAEAKITKLFSRAQTKEPYKFLNALDRDKMLNILLLNFAEEISARIQQVIAGFSFKTE